MPPELAIWTNFEITRILTDGTWFEMKFFFKSTRYNYLSSVSTITLCSVVEFYRFHSRRSKVYCNVSPSRHTCHPYRKVQHTYVSTYVAVAPDTWSRMNGTAISWPGFGHCSSRIQKERERETQSSPLASMRQSRVTKSRKNLKYLNGSLISS